jgi:hypothetical protein
MMAMPHRRELLHGLLHFELQPRLSLGLGRSIDLFDGWITGLL